MNDLKEITLLINSKAEKLKAKNVSPSYARSGYEVYETEDGRNVCNGKTWESVDKAWNHSEMLYYSY